MPGTEAMVLLLGFFCVFFWVSFFSFIDLGFWWGIVLFCLFACSYFFLGFFFLYTLIQQKSTPLLWFLGVLAIQIQYKTCHTDYY